MARFVGITNGGKPSRGTKADKRLKENKGKKRTASARSAPTDTPRSTSGHVKKV